MSFSVGNPMRAFEEPNFEGEAFAAPGGHTEEILKDVLGYSAKEIGEIKVSGAITPPEKKEKAA